MSLIIGYVIIGLLNGAFYALLSVGLALIFGLLRVVNFAHGAQLMLGAFIAWYLFNLLHVSFYFALIIAPLIGFLIGLLVERYLLRPLYSTDPVFALLLTFGLAMVLEGMFLKLSGASGRSYPAPIEGGFLIGLLYLPYYRLFSFCFAVTTCIGVWYVVERTRAGMYLRAARENPALVRTFGIRVPYILALGYGLGAALAALTGVIAAPVYQVYPFMGHELVIVAFAVVIIGGLDSIGAAIVTGLVLGLVQGLVRAFYPPAADVSIFVLMVIVLILKPHGLFGRTSE